VETVTGSRLEEYRYSSYQDYISGKKRNWVNPETILSLFGGDNKVGWQSYRDYVEGNPEKTEKAAELMMDLVIGKTGDRGRG
jgi:hypothetical protein